MASRFRPACREAAASSAGPVAGLRRGPPGRHPAGTASRRGRETAEAPHPPLAGLPSSPCQGGGQLAQRAGGGLSIRGEDRIDRPHPAGCPSRPKSVIAGFVHSS